MLLLYYLFALFLLFSSFAPLLFRLNPLTKERSLAAMKRAFADPVKGTGFMRLSVDEEALEHIALFAVESPTSNAAALAIGKAMDTLKEAKSADVPLHLRDGHGG